jgi:hypothetical protein
MFTIIGADGKQYGPVPADKVQAWIRDGRANLQTKAQRVGEAEWRTLGEFAEFSAAAVPPPLAAAPAPAPAAPVGPVDAKTYAADLIARAAPLDVFECLSRSFHLWKNNFFPLVGATLLVMLAEMVLGLIPIVGMLSGLVLKGVFYGGVYYYYLGKIRQEPREIGDAFAGFSRAFVPLMLATLVVSLTSIAIILPTLWPMLGFILEALRHPGQTMPPPHMTGAMFLGIFLAVILLIYVGVSWIFAYVLIIDKGLAPLSALGVSWRVVNHQWFRVFFTAFFGGILMLLGLFALLIGVLFTLPLLYGSVMYAYEALCNPPAKPDVSAPTA